MDIVSLFNPAKRYDHQTQMRKNIFENSHFYMGYSSKKRNDLAQSLKLPQEFIEDDADDFGKNSLNFII